MVCAQVSVPTISLIREPDAALVGAFFLRIIDLQVNIVVTNGYLAEGGQLHRKAQASPGSDVVWPTITGFIGQPIPGIEIR